MELKMMFNTQIALVRWAFRRGKPSVNVDQNIYFFDRVQMNGIKE